MGPLSFVIECLFPTRCVSCGCAGDWWCAACRAAAGCVRKDLCASCAAIKKEHDCPSNVPLDGLVAAGFYHAPPLREMLSSLKYHGVTQVLPSVRSFLRDWREARTDPWPWSGVPSLAIQSLPAAPNRVRERGFDQAVLIAKIVHDEIAPWARPVDLLVRNATSTAQASLAHGALRDANIRGAFRLKGDVCVPQNILLVDDVVTTGSSMREAARILRAAGAQKVYGLALAVGA